MYLVKLEGRWQKVSTKATSSAEEEWERVKNYAIQKTCREVLGFKAGQKQKEWLSPHTLALTDQRRSTKAKDDCIQTWQGITTICTE
jgi:nitrate/TMAO reductase-like tetraheme cytochrome c subunit